jgi:hypothetical protein
MAKRDRSLRHHCYAMQRDAEYLHEFVNQSPQPTDVSQATFDQVQRLTSSTQMQALTANIAFLQGLPVKS